MKSGFYVERSSSTYRASKAYANRKRNWGLRLTGIALLLGQLPLCPEAGGLMIIANCLLFFGLLFAICLPSFHKVDLMLTHPEMVSLPKYLKPKWRQRQERKERQKLAKMKNRPSAD